MLSDFDEGVVSARAREVARRWLDDRATARDWQRRAGDQAFAADAARARGDEAECARLLEVATSMSDVAAVADARAMGARAAIVSLFGDDWWTDVVTEERAATASRSSWERED